MRKSGKQQITCYTRDMQAATIKRIFGALSPLVDELLRRLDMRPFARAGKPVEKARDELRGWIETYLEQIQNPTDADIRQAVNDIYMRVKEGVRDFPQWLGQPEGFEQGIYQEAIIKELATQGVQGTATIQNLLRAAKKAKESVVTIGWRSRDGLRPVSSGWFGGYLSDGRPYIVTAAHCVLPYVPNANFVYLDGKPYEAEIILQDWVGGSKPLEEPCEGDTCPLEFIEPVEGERLTSSDVGVLAINDPEAHKILGAKTPLDLAQSVSEYGIAISGYWNEADILRMQDYEEHFLSGDYRSGLMADRVRKGYSGSPVIDEHGKVIALASLAGEIAEDRITVSLVKLNWLREDLNLLNEPPNPEKAIFLSKAKPLFEKLGTAELELENSLKNPDYTPVPGEVEAIEKDLEQLLAMVQSAPTSTLADAWELNYKAKQAVLHNLLTYRQPFVVSFAKFPAAEFSKTASLEDQINTLYRQTLGPYWQHSKPAEVDELVQIAKTRQFTTEQELRVLVTDYVKQKYPKAQKWPPYQPPGPAPMRPDADFTCNPTSGKSPLTVFFDASLSSAATDKGTIATYEWDFGGGATATGRTVSHTFTSMGYHDILVELTVTSDEGTQAKAAKIISIAPADPPVR